MLDRNLGVVTGIVFLLLLLPLMVRDWVVLQREALHDIQWHTATVTQLLREHLEQFRPLVAVLAELDDPQVYQGFDTRIREQIGTAGLEKIHIYDQSGELVYADDPALVGTRYMHEPALTAALRGEVVTKFIRGREYQAEYGAAVDGDMAEVYMPVRTDPTQEAAYVFEAYHDFSRFLARNRRVWLGNSAVLAAVLVSILGLLAFVYHRKRILEGRVEQLESFLPICCYCKKIRVEDQGAHSTRWQPVETYFAERDAVRFSHGICEECLKERHPEVTIR